MEYGIRRRSALLLPATSDDLAWVFHAFDQKEIWTMFGLPGPARFRIMRAHRLGTVVIGIIHKHERVCQTDASQSRIGFIVVFAPTPDFDFWEFSFAIPDAKDRDGFTALNAADAMCHYMLDHLHVETLGWRVRVDNGASEAVVRRIGYQAFDTWEVDGHPYRFYRLDQAGWGARKARLSRGKTSASLGVDGFEVVPASVDDS